KICPQRVPAADRQLPCEATFFVVACSLRPFSKGVPCCPAVGKARSEMRPPPFSFSAWTFDGGRRTFIGNKPLSNGLSKGRNQGPSSPVKKASFISRNGS